MMAKIKALRQSLVKVILTFITFASIQYLLVPTIIYSHEFIQLITNLDHQRKPRYIPKSRRNYIDHRLSDYSGIFKSWIKKGWTKLETKTYNLKTKRKHRHEGYYILRKKTRYKSSRNIFIFHTEQETDKLIERTN